MNTTNDSGTIAIPNLALGLYHVEETAAPETAKEKAAPFYVTIPYPTEDEDKNPLFVYDVHVYPKNTLEDGHTEKTVTNPDVPGLGASLTWTITTRPLGSSNEGKKLESYGLSDNLDPRLTYQTDSGKLAVVTPGSTPSAVSDEYYELSVPEAAGGELKLTFTKEGIDWINTLPSGTTFVFTYDTTATSIGIGAIINSAIENDGADDGTSSEDPTPGESTTLWGDVKLLKHANGDENSTLTGAVFTVHEATIDDDGNSSCAALEDLGNPIEIADGDSTVSEFTSDDNGEIHIPGLWVSNDEATTSRPYCAVEKTAPAGYSKLPEPLLVTVQAGISTDVDRAVPNSKASDSNVPQLPLTGAGGTLLMTVCGLLLIAIGTGATLVARKHRRNTIDE